MSFKFRSEGEFEFEATKLLLLLEGKEGKSGSAAVRVICCPSQYKWGDTHSISTSTKYDLTPLFSLMKILI